MTDLLTQAKSWLDQDPDQATRAELAALIDSGAKDELEDRFKAMLEFGTAGLRGALGAGPNRMNRVVVTMAAAGLAAYLKANGATSTDSVVIGYDARHNSDVFARDTAEIMTGAGLRALVLPRPLPTPLVAFGIRHLGAVAGVMVTATLHKTTATRFIWAMAVRSSRPQTVRSPAKSPRSPTFACCRGATQARSSAKRSLRPTKRVPAR